VSFVTVAWTFVFSVLMELTIVSRDAESFWKAASCVFRDAICEACEATCAARESHNDWTCAIDACKVENAAVTSAGVAMIFFSSCLNSRRNCRTCFIFINLPCALKIDI